MLCTLGLVLPLGVHGQSQGTAAKLSKVIVYPRKGESIADLKAQGIQKIDNYGSYWVVQATDQQAQDITKTYGDRAVNADYLNRIELNAVIVDTKADEPPMPSALKQQVETGGKHLRLIQFRGPVQPEWLDQVKAANAKIISYVPNNAYIVYVDAVAEANLGQLMDPYGPIQWMGKYHPYYKISRALQIASGTDPVKVRVAVVDDSHETLTANRIQALGSGKTSFVRNGQEIFEMDVLPQAISQIAQLPRVLWIEKVERKVLLDEVQDLILADQTNGLGNGPSTTMGITNYLDFLINTVGGGLASFIDPTTYPIVDVADTGLDVGNPPGTLSVVQPSFSVFGNPQFGSRVAYLRPVNEGYFIGATAGSGCTALNLNFAGSEDFYDHGTRVASVIAGYDTQMTESNVLLIYDTIVTQMFTGTSSMGCTGTTAQTVPFTFPDTSPCPLVTNLSVTCPSFPGATTNFMLPSEITVTQMVNLVHQDPSGFHFGLGVSPFGQIGSSRIWQQTADTIGTPPHVRFLPPGTPNTPCMEGLFPVLFFSAYSDGGRIQNNSWGEDITDTGEAGGQYTADSQTYDVGVRDALLVGSSTNVPGGTLSNNVPGPFPLNQEFIIVFAANSVLSDVGVLGTVGGIGDIRITAPGTAKNVITVGSSESVRLDGSGCAALEDEDNSDAIWQGSEFGPTLDGRFKPEIVAPGTTIYAAKSLLAAVIDPVNGITPVVNEDPNGNLGANEIFSSSLTNLYCDPAMIFTDFFPNASAGIVPTTSSGEYDCRSGSSYAAPAVSGAIQLLWWYFQNRLTNEVGQPLLQPSPAMAKAYVCNSASYLPIPDPQTGAMDTLPSIAQGMGRLDLGRMFDSVPRVLRDESTPRAIDVALITTNPAPQQTFFSQSGQSYEVSGQVLNNGLPFRVTLAWVDAPGTPSAAQELVNDLDLQVTIGGEIYKGNVFAEDHSIPGGAFDSVNNMESVFLPAGGGVTSGASYTVVVRAADIAGNGVPNIKGTSLGQDFALVIYNSHTNSAILTDVPNLATNNACQTAMLVTNFPFSFSNNLVRPAYGNVQPSPSAARGGIDEFFKIPQPTPGVVFNIDTTGSRFNTVLSVWKVQVIPQTVFVRGDCGALIEVASNSGGTSPSSVSFTADGSNDYFIVVEPQNGGPGGLMQLNINAVLTSIVVTPTSLAFPSQMVGLTSTVQTVTFKNSSSVNVLISSDLVGGTNASDFILQSDSCQGNSIPPGGSCSVQVAFIPTTNGAENAELEIFDDATGSPRLVPLTGTGLAPSPVVCLSGGSILSFSPTAIGSTSGVPQSVTITNCGTASLAISNAVISGAASNDFFISSDSCSSNSLLAGATCTLSVSFAPSVSGVRGAILTINDNFTNGPTVITLQGTGTVAAPAICASPSSIAFGSQAVNTTSTSPTSVTISNCGTAALIVSNITVTGANAGEFVLTNVMCSPLPSTLAIGGTCTFGVSFAPTNLASKTASVIISNNSSVNPLTISLTGAGTGFQPDLAINNNLNLKRFKGLGVFSTPTNVPSSETLIQGAIRGSKKVFYVLFKNAGDAADAFQLSVNEERLIVTNNTVITTNATVKYFLGANPRDSTDVTSMVEGGSYTNATLAPGAFTDDSTLLRVEITVNRNTRTTKVLSGTNTVVITGTSVTSTNNSDSVKAQVVVR